MPKIPQKPRELPAENNYPAVCVHFIDLGTQVPKNPDWEPARKCSIGFELGKRKDGKPFTVSLVVTYSSFKTSTMMKHLTSWLSVKNGTEIDTDELLGKGALVNVTHSEDGQFANISTVAKLPANMKAPKASIAPFSLYLSEGIFDRDVFENLTDKQKEKIEASPEYQDLNRVEKKPAAKTAAKVAKKK